ncbi:hypothetical protein [Niallia sp. Krafla_26]|uniref:hypothetical protein n=1 Tax=Niallia sp. Krafla_26 TaxID=3064703 RepID=UPI003D166105
MKKKWQDFYLFMFDVKTTGCIYFVAFVFFYFVFGVINDRYWVTLDFWTSMQIMLACLLIGVGQGIFLPKNHLSLPRIIIWAVWALLVTVGFSEGFQWFQMYPRWYSFGFYSIIAISFFFFWVALNWRLERETKELNHALVKYKKNELG